MHTNAHVLQTPLRNLDFSPECLRWFQDAGVHTVEDTEEDITLLLRSKYYTDALLQEMIRVIREAMCSNTINDNQIPDDNKPEKLLQKIKSNNNVIRSLVALLRRKGNR